MLHAWGNCGLSGVVTYRVNLKWVLAGDAKLLSHSCVPPLPCLAACSRFFELYHASRESFIYLQQFYQGELLPAERGVVPAPDEPPSADFLQQLREFTSWRMQPERAATHLGERRGAKGSSGQRE